MATPKTTFLLSDITGTVLGEIRGAKSSEINLPHMRLHTAQFQLPIWNPRAEEALNQDCLVWGTRTDHLGVRRPIFAGPVLSVEENASADAQTVAITAVSGLWRLNKRVLGTSKAGYAVGTPTVPVDLGEIMQTIVDTVNGVGFTGVLRGTTVATNPASIQQVWLKPAAQQIAELAASINAPEFEIAPVAIGSGSQGGFPILGYLNAKPLIGGVTREDAIFEFGTTRANVSSYTRARSLDGVMTKGWITASGWPDGTPQELITATRDDSIVARGVYEDVVSDSGIIDDGLRASLLDAHLDVRKSWRQTITFTPAVNARPGFQTDYVVGDFVRCRAVVRGKLRFDAFFRVWGVKLTYDETGNEQVELELLPQAAGV